MTSYAQNKGFQTLETTEANSDPPSPIKDPDEAYNFLRNVDVSHADLAAVNLPALRRRVDWHIVPLMFGCYIMQFIDKVSLNYAAVMGLNKDLRLKGNEFTNTATVFFIAFLIAEIPTGYILNRVHASTWLGVNVILWGVVTACTATAHDYHSLLAVRILLGVFEAAIQPCVIIISSQWYTKSEQAPRFCLWHSGQGIGQIMGGIVSFGFQHVEHASIAGWRVMFIILGAVTVVIGTATLFLMPDTPMKANFLTTTEKVAILRHTASNQTGVRNRNFRVSHLLDAVTDIQLWLMVILTMLISVPSGIITTYSATLVRSFGFKPPIAALLVMPSGIVSIISTLSVGFVIRFTSNRWLCIIACCVPAIMGGALLSFMPYDNHAGLLAGIYLVNAIVATLIVIFQWASSNVAGHTKRVVTMALITGSFGVGNIIGPQTFQARDAPEYLPAKIAVLATQVAAAAVAATLFGYYVWENRRRDRGNIEGGGESGQWENLTDKENMSFRFVWSPGTRTMMFWHCPHVTKAVAEIIREGMPLITTKEGALGWAHPEVRLNEEIFLIEGCSLPIVLRSHIGEQGYQVVGHAFVDGYMDGSAWTKFGQEKLVRIDIR